MPARKPSSMRGTAISAVARSRLIVRMISAGFVGMLEHHRRAQQRRNKQRHELPEHMAERHQRHEAQRMKPLLVLAIRIDSALERLEIRQKISVGQNDAARLGRRARREENLRDMVASDRLIGKDS